METCLVLLSTYNGEKYLKEQLESIISQDVDCFVKIYIRDDGSNDKTWSIIKEYEERYPTQIISESGENLGIHRSFLYMIKNSVSADYYAFCDQDDVWKIDKLKKTIEVIRREDKKVPVLVYSGYLVVDDKLKLIKYEFPDTNESTKSIIQILCHNKIPGCTEVFNSSLIKILQCIEIDALRMHDSYVCAVAYIYGKVFAIDEGLILYRQHNGNALGYNKTRKFSKRVKDKIKLLIKGETYSTAEIAQSILLYNTKIIDIKKINELKMLAQYNSKLLQKVRLFLDTDTSSNHRMSTLSIKFRIIFNRL